MLSYSASTTINATPEAIWEMLTDVARWAEWNTTVDKVEGEVALGKKVTVYAKVSPGRAFAVKVSVLEPPRKMVWTGGMPLGLFKGERTYTLEPKSDGSVAVTTSEVFSGLISPLITRSMPDMQQSFDEFVVALKKRSEQA